MEIKRNERIQGLKEKKSKQRKRTRVTEEYNKKFWKELTRELSLLYLTMLYQLPCLTAVNYVPSFPW
jgi:hypothetical protein